MWARGFRGTDIALDGVKKDVAFPNQDAPRQQRSQGVCWYPLCVCVCYYFTSGGYVAF